MKVNFVGDKPASNWVAGFKESASAKKPCRFCYIENTDMENVHHGIDCSMRSKESHTKDLEDVLKTGITKQCRRNLSMKTGVVGESIFSQLSYFDVTKCFVSDNMHLLDEGIENLEVRKMFNKLLTNEMVDLDKINAKLSNVIQQREFTRPPPLRKDEILTLTKLSMSTSEMAALTLILPLFLSEYVSSTDNAYFANFFLLLEIFSSLQCYSFAEKDLLELEMKIKIHNSTFVSLYPKEDSGSAITPKLHALLHMTEQIRMFGPPRYSACYRYE
jgi:hypothetical protein